MGSFGRSSTTDYFIIFMGKVILSKNLNKQATILLIFS